MVNCFYFFVWGFLFCFGEDFFQLFFLVWCKDKKKWGYCKNIYFLLVITKIRLCGSWTLNLGEFNLEGFFNLMNCREGNLVRKSGIIFWVIVNRIEKKIKGFSFLSVWQSYIICLGFFPRDFFFKFFEAKFEFRCFDGILLVFT